MAEWGMYVVDGVGKRRHGMPQLGVCCPAELRPRMASYQVVERDRVGTRG